MPFGKHRKKFMALVPASYLLWLKDELVGKLNEDQQAVLDYINDNLELLEREIKTEQKRKHL